MLDSGLEIRAAKEDELKIWDWFVQNSQTGTIFHTLMWASLIQEAFKIEFIPVVINLKDEVIGIFPLYLEGRILRRLMSPPSFVSTAYGGWVLQSDYTSEHNAITRQILKYLRGVERSKMVFWSKITLPPFTTMPTSLNYGYDKGVGSTYIMDLKPDIEQIWMNMEKRGRTAVKKAQKEKVDIEENKDEAHLKHHLNMLNTTYSIQGLMPPSPLIKERAWMRLNDAIKLFVAKCNGEVIASIIVLIFGTRIYYWSGAYNYDYREKNPTNLLLWHAIKYAKKQGMEQFDLMGANVSRIAKFKRTFGGRLLEYPIISKKNLLISTSMHFYPTYARKSKLLTSIVRRI